ncbi:hypothetical protein [Nocardia salmonicida]|uniref:hypothetical protein n=1 Tax=Nocardia salmonicida TaxID=53431 RepID=UPI003437BBBC
MLQDAAMEKSTDEVRADTPLNQFLDLGYNAGGVMKRTTEIAVRNGIFSDGEVEHDKSALEVFKAADNMLRGSGGIL